MYTPVQVGRLYERIVEQIERQILSGDMREGDRLPNERELAEQFGVSRTAVREAIKALAQKGLVDVFVGRGTFVANRTERVMRDTFGLMMRVGQERGHSDLVEVRGLIEPEIAALAAERAGASHIAALEAAVVAMDEALDDMDRFIVADQEFHRVLAQATGNDLILRIIEPIMDMLDAQRRQIAHVDGGMVRGQHHHRQILAAVREHNPEAARETMRAHLAQVREDALAAPPIVEEPPYGDKQYE
ncbi:MAG TPA: FadR/GntR family transcriptional regulator [Chloroflexaceae bacterium]|nr:FadR/GntR family transcriptional regulator [Chloroflexaceae bacterium]